jgi:hypothetical protein
MDLDFAAANNYRLAQEKLTALIRHEWSPEATRAMTWWAVFHQRMARELWRMAHDPNRSRGDVEVLVGAALAGSCAAPTHVTGLAVSGPPD